MTVGVMNDGVQMVMRVTKWCVMVVMLGCQRGWLIEDWRDGSRTSVTTLLAALLHLLRFWWSPRHLHRYQMLGIGPLQLIFVSAFTVSFLPFGSEWRRGLSTVGWTKWKDTSRNSWCILPPHPSFDVFRKPPAIGRVWPRILYDHTREKKMRTEEEEVTATCWSTPASLHFLLPSIQPWTSWKDWLSEGIERRDKSRLHKALLSAKHSDVE